MIAAFQPAETQPIAQRPDPVTVEQLLQRLDGLLWASRNLDWESYARFVDAMHARADRVAADLYGQYRLEDSPADYLGDVDHGG